MRPSDVVLLRLRIFDMLGIVPIAGGVEARHERFRDRRNGRKRSLAKNEIRQRTRTDCRIDYRLGVVKSGLRRALIVALVGSILDLVGIEDPVAEPEHVLAVTPRIPGDANTRLEIAQLREVRERAVRAANSLER